MLLLSCEPDMESIKALVDRENTPGIIAKKNEIIYTENGIPRLKLIAPVTKSFQFAPEPYTEFPEGIQLFTFSDGKSVESFLTAKYAVYYDKKKIWEARHNVVAMNKKGEILNTERLFWDEQKKIVYSNDFVKFTSVDGVIFGEGFEADELLENVEIKNSSGTIFVADKD